MQPTQFTEKEKLFWLAVYAANDAIADCSRDFSELSKFTQKLILVEDRAERTLDQVPTPEQVLMFTDEVFEDFLKGE